MGIAATVVTITPQIATEWLAKSAGNRSLSNSAVSKYASDMTSRRWMLNGEGIIFDNNGALRDGHHRLAAIIKANVSVKSLVVTGVNPNECAVLDMGRARTVRDTMLINGFNNWKSNTAIHGCVRLYYRLIHKNFNPSYQEILDFIDDNETELNAISEHLHIGGGNQKTYFSKRSPIVFAVLSALKYGVPEQRLWEFMETLNSGIANGKEESSVIKLRNMLIMRTLDSAAAKSVDTVYAAENAIRDFVNKTPRIKDYKNCKPIYSDKVWGKEQS